MSELVWLVDAYDHGTDRVCDTAETGKRLCDDLLSELGASHKVVEDWRNHNIPAALPRWARYLETDRGRVICQSVEARTVDHSGLWFAPTAPTEHRETDRPSEGAPE